MRHAAVETVLVITFSFALSRQCDLAHVTLVFAGRCGCLHSAVCYRRTPHLFSYCCNSCKDYNVQLENQKPLIQNEAQADASL